MTELITWKRAFEHTVFSLLGNYTASAHTALAAFGAIALEWQELPFSKAPPFVSGISPGGSPLECSIHLPTSGRYQLRFVTEPHHPHLSLGANLDHMRRRALDFLSQWSGKPAAAFASSAFALFPDQDQPIAERLFFLWLGLVIDPERGAGATKLYLNPWATLPEKQGMYSIYALLDLAGLADNALSWIRQLMTCGIPMIPHIVGINLNAAGATAIKIYFVASSVPLHAIKRLMHEWPAPLGNWDPLLELVARERDSGDVQCALLFQPREPIPQLKVCLACPDWFSADARVLETIEQACGNHVVLDRLQSLCQTQTLERTCNFLSLENKGITLYFQALA